MFEKLCVHVEADHSPDGSHPGTQKVGNASRSAAEIETIPTPHVPEPIEHCDRIRHHGLGLDMETLDFSSTALDRIVSRIPIAHLVAAPDAGGTKVRSA